MINDSLERFHTTFDIMTQAVVEFGLKFVEKLNALNVKDINLNDVEDIGWTKKKFKVILRHWKEKRIDKREMSQN